MNRVVLKAKFHNQIFIAGLNLGDSVSEEVTSRWRDLKMRADYIGVYLDVITDKGAKGSGFVPWPNVAYVTLGGVYEEPAKSVSTRAKLT